MGDHVQCFYCDGGLKNWDPIDVPWAEHARWFGNCAYLRLKLGKIFVDWVKNVNYLDQRAVEQKIKEIENRYGDQSSSSFTY